MAADTLGILLISGEYARGHYAFVLAAGAAAIGRQVIVFASNDGCHALALDLSRYTEAEAGVRASGVADLVTLRQASSDLGVRMIACEAGLRVSSLTAALAPGVEVAGVVTFLEAIRGGQVITL